MNYPEGPQRPYRHNQPPPARQPYGPPGQHRPPQQPPQHRPPPPPPQQYRPPPPPPPAQYRPPPHQQQFAQPPAPQQPQQPYGNPYAQPSEGIAVDTQFFPLAFLLFFFKPKIAVDGQEMTVNAWGRTVLPARPGQHHVHVHVPYFLPSKLGPADATAEVRPGQLAELEYKAPMFAFSPGSLGVGPQKYNGVGITIAIALIPFAIIFLLVLLSFVLAVI